MLSLHRAEVHWKDSGEQKTRDINRVMSRV